MALGMMLSLSFWLGAWIEMARVHLSSDSARRLMALGTPGRGGMPGGRGGARERGHGE